MPESSPKPRRRWFQFSLGTLFVLVTVFAIWLGWELKFIRERNSVRESLRAGSVEIVQSRHWGLIRSDVQLRVGRPAAIPWWRGMLGDEAISIITFPPSADESDLEAASEAFPEATVGVFPGAEGKGAVLTIPLPK
jgi:hypothetical protein